MKALAPIGPEKSATEIFIGEKEQGTNKGTDKQYVAFLVTRCILSLSSFVLNFRILTQVVAEKSLIEKNAHMYHIRVKERKNEKLKKESKMRISILISIYTLHFAYLKVYTKF